MLVAFAFLFLLSIAFVKAESCSVGVNLINQDPYPAMPGEYVRVVFQLTGIENPECGDIGFSIMEEFPFSLDPEAEKEITLRGGTYAGREFNSYLIIPYKIRIHEDALEGNNSLKVAYYTGKNNSRTNSIIKDFEITIEDVRTDFELSIKDYDVKTHTLTLEILNIGEDDAEALTVEVPKQENIEIKGSSRSILGSLDSKEDSTFTFEAVPQNGEIKVNVLYTDEINIRRILEKTMTFDSLYFEGRKRDEVAPKPASFYVAIILVIFIILSWIFNWHRRRRKRMQQMKYSKK